MYELEPKDARDLARMLGEQDHEQELNELKKEQQKIKNELLKTKLKQEQNKLQQQTPPERENTTKNARIDIATIFALTCSMLSALVPFVLMLIVFTKY